MSASAPHLNALFVLMTAAACTGPPQFDPLAPRPMRTLSRWAVSQGQEALGEVSLLEIDDPDDPIRYYRASNRAGQWLGYIDGQGRVYQRQPFAESEVFLGIYPMAEGLALLYEVPSAVELLPIDPSGGQPAEANFHFPPREDR